MTVDPNFTDRWTQGMLCLDLWSFLCVSFSKFTPKWCLLSQSYRKGGNLDPINVSQDQNKREHTPVIWVKTFSGVADTQIFCSSPCSASSPAGRRKPRHSGLCVHQHPRPWAGIGSLGEAHQKDTSIKCRLLDKCVGNALLPPPFSSQSFLPCCPWGSSRPSALYTEGLSSTFPGVSLYRHASSQVVLGTQTWHFLFI